MRVAFPASLSVTQCASEDGTGRGSSGGTASETFCVHATQDSIVSAARAHSLGANSYQAVAYRDPAPTLTNKMQGSSGWAPYNEDAHLVGQFMQVRRLTPTECERLQGFPDGYTAIPWRGKPADHCPDGPRYKALGNSMAVPCMAWIGKRIQEICE